MSKSAPESRDTTPSSGTSEIGAQWRQLERRDWWLWSSAILVILALTAGIISLAVLLLLKEKEPFFRFNLEQGIRGLVGLVLLFSLYAIYQQVRMKRLRRQLDEQKELAGKERVRAEEFYKLAMLDPLTGLHNRRYAEERLEAEMSRSRRHGYPLTVLMLDLNDFKQINDHYGHPAGDLVLKEFSRRLSKATRGSDLAVRLAGDEFLVLLPECQLGHVEHVLGRLRSMQVDWQGGKIDVSFSAGWTNYQPNERLEELIRRADHALYVCKKDTASGVQQPALTE